MPSAWAWAECESREMVWTTASNREPLKSSSGSNMDSSGHSNTWEEAENHKSSMSDRCEVWENRVA